MNFNKKASEVDPEIGEWVFKYNKRTGVLKVTSEVFSPDFDSVRGTITEVLASIYENSGIPINEAIIEVDLSNVGIDKVKAEQDKISKELGVKVKITPLVKKEIKPELEDEVHSGGSGRQIVPQKQLAPKLR